MRYRSKNVPVVKQCPILVYNNNSNNTFDEIMAERIYSYHGKLKAMGW
jgi:hypothetical protein